MNPDGNSWCHDCDAGIFGFAEFLHHANDGHAITDARCPGACQFRRNDSHDYVRWDHCDGCYATFERVNGVKPL